MTETEDVFQLDPTRSSRYRYPNHQIQNRRYSAPAAVPHHWRRELLDRWLCRHLRVLGRSISIHSGALCCQTLCGVLTEGPTLHYTAILASAFRRFFHREGSGSRVDTSRPTLTSSQIRELKAAFSMLDKNKDGRVNETEIKCMLEKLGIVLTDTMVGKLIDQASKRGDRLLSEDEFLSWMAHQSVQEDVMADLMAAFRVFDKDRNGYITRDELRTAMEMIGEPMSEEQLDLMIRATDTDNDGKINYEEFVRMLL
ncbi:unnamed protein product [Larinioides sclopetarius]|uniref:EF-hand domain-containing protein n=1 Tax=Larinioides sclopetarius TaxID=280406 RepID=A0AAV2B118_9ARAC